ncbi:hypothetical protein LINGRAHAP2_LOCUS28811 [Linum grandiflorum]
MLPPSSPPQLPNQPFSPIPQLSRRCPLLHFSVPSFVHLGFTTGSLDRQRVALRPIPPEKFTSLWVRCSPARLPLSFAGFSLKMKTAGKMSLSGLKDLPTKIRSSATGPIPMSMPCLWINGSILTSLSTMIISPSWPLCLVIGVSSPKSWSLYHVNHTDVKHVLITVGRSS